MGSRKYPFYPFVSQAPITSGAVWSSEWALDMYLTQRMESGEYHVAHRFRQGLALMATIVDGPHTLPRDSRVPKEHLHVVQLSESLDWPEAIDILPHHIDAILMEERPGEIHAPHLIRKGH